MSKFCVIKSSIPQEESCAIVNQDDIKFLAVMVHPVAQREVYHMITSKAQYLFTEFVTKESSLQEAIEYFHHQLYKSI